MYRHIIPRNISDTGSLLGISRYRNALEAGIILLIDVILILTLMRSLPLVIRVILFMMLLIPAAIALSGIDDRSLSEYLIDVIRFKRIKGVTKYRLPQVYVIEKKNARK